MSRLFDPKRKDGSFPFEMTPRLRTDVRATWDRVCPGWRDRKPIVPQIQEKRKA